LNGDLQSENHLIPLNVPIVWINYRQWVSDRSEKYPPEINIQCLSAKASVHTGHIATIAYGTRLGFVGNDILTLIVNFDDSNVKTGCDG